MQCPEPHFERLVALPRRLDGQYHFPLLLDATLPGISRVDAAQPVDTGRQLLVHEVLRDTRRRRLVGARADHHDRLGLHVGTAASGRGWEDSATAVEGEKKRPPPCNRRFVPYH